MPKGSITVDGVSLTVREGEVVGIDQHVGRGRGKCGRQAAGEPVPIGAAEETAGTTGVAAGTLELAASGVASGVVEAVGAVPLAGLSPRARMRAAAASAATMTIACVLPVGRSG